MKTRYILSCLLLGGALSVSAQKMAVKIVHVLHVDDGVVDERADGNGESAEGHGVDVECYLEPSLKEAAPYESFQFVRQGFFCADYKDSKPGVPVFNRIVSLKSSFKLPKQG